MLNFIVAVNAMLRETERASGRAGICIITVYVIISLIRRTLLGSFGCFCFCQLRSNEPQINRNL